MQLANSHNAIVYNTKLKIRTIKMECERFSQFDLLTPATVTG